MMKSVLAAIASLALMASAASVYAKAAPCRDTKGKFVKCPEKSKAAQRCRNVKGRFAKCGTPGATPAK
jgi:hypothetical protein